MKNKNDQNKKDRVKEYVMKGLLLLGGAFEVAMVVLAFVGGVYRGGEYAWLFVPLAFGCLAVAVICLIVLFAIGNTLKTGNPKDYKIKKYICGIDKPVRESCQAVYGEVHNFDGGSQGFYCTRIKEEGLTRSEVYCFACIEVDESFNESSYVSKIESIADLNRKDIYARTLIVCFIERQPCEYVRDIMHSPAYYGLNEVLILCAYDEKNKTLNVNKTKCAFGDKGYNDARRELKNIFSFVTPKKTEAAQNEENQEIKIESI